MFMMGPQETGYNGNTKTKHVKEQDIVKTSPNVWMAWTQVKDTCR